MQRGKTGRTTTKDSATFNSNHNHKCKGQSSKQSTHFRKFRGVEGLAKDAEIGAVERKGVRWTVLHLFYDQLQLEVLWRQQRDETEEANGRSLKLGFFVLDKLHIWFLSYILYFNFVF